MNDVANISVEELPHPHQEQKVTNFHRNLTHCMGTGAPRRLKVHNDFGR